MIEPGRKFVQGVKKYRYSFNSQEKTDEISGTGNHTTAEFWEYDTRLGRRWNVDPVYKHSPYECFAGNPIWYSDPMGLDTPKNKTTVAALQFIANKYHFINPVDKFIINLFPATKTGDRVLGAAIGTAEAVGATIQAPIEAIKHPVQTVVGIMKLQSGDPMIGISIYSNYLNSKDKYGVDYTNSNYIAYGITTIGLAFAAPETIASKPAVTLNSTSKLGVVAAERGLTNPLLVQKSATLAEKAIGGTGGVAGTVKHQYASTLLNRYQSINGSRGLETGLYFNNGVGNRGFLDVIDHTNGIIYDYKFGNAVMSPAQFGKYLRNFGLPIQVIKP